MLEQEHRYGSQVHLLSDPPLHSVLAKLCSPETFQPLINEYVELLYSRLVHRVLSDQFATQRVQVPTRMTAFHPGALLDTVMLDPAQRVVCVNLARAGTFPSHICYRTLNYELNPAQVRQDHILASRVTNAQQQVTGTFLGGAKIGGDIDQAIVLFPDPMGATGNTIISSLNHYKQDIEGTAAKFIALHLIVTPEYLKNVLSAHPDVIIYAIRLDRGLSSADVLKTAPGTHWERERGLNDKHYIVPGGGGFGEIMNNSFV
jgi:uracil phosphoribosyltransferase